MTFASNLRQLRKERGMSQDELAEKLGYKSFTTIQKWESGVSEPSMEKVKAIADIFGVTIEQLVNGSVEPQERFTGSSKTLTLVHAKSASAPLHAPDLPPDEQRLLDIYRDLSDDGKAVLLNYADDMSHLGKYKKRTPDERDKLFEGSGQSQLRENMKYDFGDMPLSRVAESASKYKKGK